MDFLFPGLLEIEGHQQEQKCTEAFKPFFRKNTPKTEANENINSPRYRTCFSSHVFCHWQMEKNEKDHFNQHIFSFILKTLDKC